MSGWLALSGDLLIASGVSTLKRCERSCQGRLSLSGAGCCWGNREVVCEMMVGGHSQKGAGCGGGQTSLGRSRCVCVCGGGI